MATLTALSLPILPSKNRILPFLSPVHIRCRMRRRPPTAAGATGGRKANCRKVPPKLPQIDTPVSARMPAPSLRCDCDEGNPLLDSRNFAGEGDLLTTDKEEEIYSSSKDAPHRNESRLSDVRFFGVDLPPDNVAVTMVYFVQGVLGLSRLAVSFYLKDDLHLDPAETALISGVSALPWLIKPLYGFVSDSFPLFGYRRRSYLVFSGLLGALSWSLMANSVDSKYGATLCILLGSLSVAFSDVLSLACQN